MSGVKKEMLTRCWRHAVGYLCKCTSNWCYILNITPLGTARIFGSTTFHRFVCLAAEKLAPLQGCFEYNLHERNCAALQKQKRCGTERAIMFLYFTCNLQTWNEIYRVNPGAKELNYEYICFSFEYLEKTQFYINEALAHNFKVLDYLGLFQPLISVTMTTVIYREWEN